MSLNAKGRKVSAKALSRKRPIRDTPSCRVGSQRMDENDLSGVIIGCGMRVHTALVPGLLESAYEECLYYELKNE